MRTSLVGDALDMAVSARRPDEDGLLIHHSDRGSQLRLNRSSQQWVSDEPTGRGRRPGYQRPCSFAAAPR
jgi:transposase InsO family protein